MDLILTDSKLNDVTFINCDADIALGEDDNTFELKIRRSEWSALFSFGNAFYIPGTEYGGYIGEVKTQTSLDTISVLGYTWRGNISKHIIKPKSNSENLKVNGELNSVLAQLIPFFNISTEDTGVTVEYEFEPYINLLDGVEAMLNSVGYKLKIQFVQGEAGAPGYIECSAVPIVDYSSLIELSQDSQLDFIFDDIRNGVNHLICTGQDENENSISADLYVQADGSIGESQFYFGVEEIAQIFEGSSSTVEDLKAEGVEEFKSLMNKKTFSMNVEELNLEYIDIGDVIGGRDYTTGLSIKKPIVGKIFKIENGKETVEFTIEGEE